MTRQDAIDVVVAYNGVAMRRGRRPTNFNPNVLSAARKLIRWCAEQKIQAVPFIRALEAAPYFPGLRKLCDQELLTHWHGRDRFAGQVGEKVRMLLPEVERRKRLHLLRGEQDICRLTSHSWGGYNESSEYCRECRACKAA